MLIEEFTIALIKVRLIELEAEKEQLECLIKRLDRALVCPEAEATQLSIVLNKISCLRVEKHRLETLD